MIHIKANIKISLNSYLKCDYDYFILYINWKNYKIQKEEDIIKQTRLMWLKKKYIIIAFLWPHFTELNVFGKACLGNKIWSHDYHSGVNQIIQMVPILA